MRHRRGAAIGLVGERMATREVEGVPVSEERQGEREGGGGVIVGRIRILGFYFGPDPISKLIFEFDSPLKGFLFEVGLNREKGRLYRLPVETTLYYYFLMYIVKSVLEVKKN